MKKLALLLPLLLVGCGGMSTGETVTQIREKTTALCGFLPTVKVVTSILAAAEPSVFAATTIATAICSAVGNQDEPLGLLSEGVSEGEGRPCPMVEGVCIEGEWVDGRNPE